MVKSSLINIFNNLRKTKIQISFCVFVLSLLVVFTFVEQPVKALTVDELISASPATPTVINLNVSAKSSLVLNQITGEALFTDNAEALRVPASLTKLATALVVLDGVNDWNKQCTVTNGDQVGGVGMRFSSGFTYTMNSLLYAALLPSANDAAHALARCSGLSMDEFVSQMNAKAKQFGATKTRFVEPTGLSPENITTAKDFAGIANAAFSTEKLRNILSKARAMICSAGSVRKCQTLVSTNKLLGDTSFSVVAGKTGFLSEAGYNFAASIKDKDGHYYITVVLGSNSLQSRFSETKQVWAVAYQKQRQLDAGLNLGIPQVAGVKTGMAGN